MAHGLLYLGSDIDQLYRVERGGLTPVAGDTRFDALSVVVDFVEESLVRASLPKMFGRDMSALVQRRLEQEFRETPYRASARLGPSRSDKQLDYLFIGLPIARRLDERLRPLVEQGVAIRGVFTPSMLAAHWARRGRAGDASRLIVLPTPAGVRFILLDRGQAVLSRLTTGPDLGDAEASRALGDELERTVQYLYNARLVERGQRIDLWLWGSEPACRGLLERDMVGLQHAQGPVDRQLGDPGKDGLACLLRLCAVQPPAEQLASNALRRFHALAQLRRGLLLGGAGIGLLLALFAGWYWQQALQLREQAGQLQQQAAEAEAENEILRERAAAVDADPLTVAESLRSFDTYLQGVPWPRPVLVATSRAFDSEPGYRLDSLRWDVVDPPRVDPLTGMLPEPPAGGCPPPWPADPITGEQPARPRAGLALRGEVTGDAPLRDVLASRQRFEAALASVPGMTLRTQAAAVDASGSGVLRGGGEAADARDFDYCLSAEPGE